MNRRDALQALTALPALSGLSVATVHPTDVIVAEFDGQLSMAERDNIQKQLSQVWPNRKIVVCDGALRLKVLRDR